MCRGHHHEHGRRGRHGTPNREQWVERLEAHREHLEEELKNIQELLERLSDKPEPAGAV